MKVYMLLALIILAILVVAPIGVLVYGSFYSAAPGDLGYYTLDNYQEMLVPRTFAFFSNSVLFGLGTAVLAVSGGAFLAFVAERTTVPLRKFIYVFVIAIFLSPPYAYAIAWMFLLGPHIGLINQALELLSLPTTSIHNMVGLVLVSGFYNLPLAFLPLAAAFRGMDTSLEEAARTSGSRGRQIIYRVTLPLMRPAFLSTSVLLFVISLSEIAIPFIIGRQAGIHVFTTKIYQLIAIYPAQYGVGSALSVVLLVSVLALVIFHQRLLKKSERFVTISGKSFKPGRYNLGAWTFPISAAAILFVFFASFLPNFAIIFGSFLKYLSWTKATELLTLTNFGEALATPMLQRAFTNSTLLAVIGPTVTTFLVFLVMYLSIRTKVRGRGLLDVLTMAPLGIPSLVLALALLWVFLSFPLGIYGTIWILLVAYVINYMPFAARSMSGGFYQIHQDLEDSSRMSGSSTIGTLVRIVFPLMKPSFAAAWIIVSLLMMRELNASMLLYGFGSEVLSVVTITLLDHQSYTVASALTVMIMVISLIIVLGARRILGRGLL